MQPNDNELLMESADLLLGLSCALVQGRHHELSDDALRLHHKIVKALADRGIHPVKPKVGRAKLPTNPTTLKTLGAL